MNPYHDPLVPRTQSTEQEVVLQPVIKKQPYVSPWASFSKLPEEEKAKIFNSMRGALITSGIMENGK